MDLSRREFMLAGTTSLLSLNTSVSQINPDDTDSTEYEFQGVADLVGPKDALPGPDDPFWDDKIAYAYRYEAIDVGERFFKTEDDPDWQNLTMFPETQVEEVRTENYNAFFNHTFARPGAPDSKNWAYTDADVTKQDSEVKLASTTTLESTQRGNYPAGVEAIPGVAFRVTGTPTAGSAEAGYFTANNGGGVGEDSTDSYVFLRKGGTTKKVYRSDWNGYAPDSRVWTGNRPVITRLPHLFYGGGDFEIRAILHRQDESTLRTLHTFTPENVDDTFSGGPPFDQPNLPIRFESSNLSGGSLQANAAHYEFGEVKAENRVNGEHFTNISVSETGWTPLLIWQKRTNWEMVNVQPLQSTVSAASSDVKLGIQLNPELTVNSTALPENTSSDETAVEIVDATVDAFGERRWAGYTTAGQGIGPGVAADDDLTFNLPANQPVMLVAQGVGGSATVSGCVSWEEYF
jgi:hypothetical protein